MAGVVILARAQDWHTEDSVLIDADCGCRCWIGPESLTFKESHPEEIETSCLPCTGLSVEEMLAGEVPNMRAIPGQRDKLNQLWGEEATDKAYTRLGVQEWDEDEK